MKLKELQDIALMHYLIVYTLLEQDDNMEYLEAAEIVRFEGMTCGICSYMKLMLDEYVYGDNWIVKYCTNGKTWGIYPAYCKSKEDLLRALNVRITNLQKELNESSK